MRRLGWTLLTILYLFLPAIIAEGAQKYPEKYYQDKWCTEQGGKQEVRLDDGTRIDCLTDEYAIEVEFAHKWAESIGQAQYYAIKTNRRPGVLLIFSEGDQRYLARLNTVADQVGIKVFTINAISKQSGGKGGRRE